MKFAPLLSALCLFSLCAAPTVAEEQKPAPAPNGLEIPEGFENWAVISISHRLDRESMRVILGNDIAVKAARSGQTSPWPDGAIIAKVAWTETSEEDWPAAVVPGKLLNAEFMFKDSKKFAANGTGWGWARWKGPDRTPCGARTVFHVPGRGSPVRVRRRGPVIPVPVPDGQGGTIFVCCLP